MNLYTSPKTSIKIPTEAQLRSRIKAFLANTYHFVRLEIDTWMGAGIRYIPKARLEVIDIENRTGEQLLNDRYFENWMEFSDKTINNLADEFLFQNLLQIKGQKRLIKRLVTKCLESDELTVNVKSSPILKAQILDGRKKGTRKKPLPSSVANRVPIELEAGQMCWICTRSTAPYIANPGLVLKKFQDGYRIIYFTNIKGSSEGTKLEINYHTFRSPTRYEIGLTPEQAILQKW